MHKHEFRLEYDADAVFLECRTCDLLWRNDEIIELINALMEDVNKMSGLWYSHFPKPLQPPYIVSMDVVVGK